MQVVECRRYTPQDTEAWDHLIEMSRSPHFFFKRGYMEYHADRFNDHSLIFSMDGKDVAVLPANADGASIYSHQGLTYGGVIASKRVTQANMLAIFDTLVEYLARTGFAQLTYKVLPSIYFDPVAQDDLYALWRLGASLTRREPSSAMSIVKERADYTKGKKHSLGLAKKAGIQVARSVDWAGYMNMLAGVLRARHQTAPVHSLAEIELLASRFPQNIQLYVAHQGSQMLAGTIVFVNEMVIHTQYMAATIEGRDVGALDAVVDHLILVAFSGKKYLSFGISSEQGGQLLNEGLIQSKEAFGARTIVHDCYTLTI